MADIAAKLGVSIVSVSKALAGKEGVGEEMRARILATAKEMGYQFGQSQGGWPDLYGRDRPPVSVHRAGSRLYSSTGFVLHTLGLPLWGDYGEVPAKDLLFKKGATCLWQSSN